MSADQRQRRLEHWVHWTLLGGLMVSALLLVTGMLALVTGGKVSTPPPQSLGALLREGMQFHGPALTVLGLLVLMITPILRVIVLLIGWSLEREWRFTAVALAVLALLIASLVLGVG